MDTAFNAEAFAIILALIGVVIMIAALISGLIERTNLPQVVEGASSIDRPAIPSSDVLIVFDIMV